MNEKIVIYGLITIALIISSLFIIWQNGEKPLSSMALKAFSSFLFVVIGVVGMFLNRTTGFAQLFIVLGLFASVFGDLFLALLEFKFGNKEHKIKIGMVCFSVAHIFYIIGLNFLCGFEYFYISISSAVLIALAVVFGEKMLKLNYGGCKLFVGGYSYFLGASLVQSLVTAIVCGFSLSTVVLLVGFVLFFASDLVLSFIYFGKNWNRKLYYPNLALYYLAQILIASMVFFV